jgi:hypothetical protein
MQPLHKVVPSAAITMETIDISGTWQGEIIYGKKYREYEGKALFFDAEFIQHLNSIQGTAIDTRGVGVNPDPAKISGTINRNDISFIKQYATLATMHKDGSTLIDKSKPGPKIHFCGAYDQQSAKFTGTWEYSIKVWAFGFIPMSVKAGGAWSMTKK